MSEKEKKAGEDSSEKSTDLERARFELEKYKAQQEAELQRQRLVLERAKQEREARFHSNPALLSAAISFAAVLVSGAQIWVAHISKDKELLLADKQRERELVQQTEERRRQYNFESVKLIIQHRDQILAGDPATNQRMIMLLNTILPEEVVAQILDRPGSAASTASTRIQVVIEKVSGDGQSIPLGAWRNFAVRVLDERQRPAVGAKVAWRMPSVGSFTYVGVTDEKGVTTATNMYSASTAGAHSQIAVPVDQDSPVGFTDASRAKPIADSVTFTFRQE